MKPNVIRLSLAAGLGLALVSGLIFQSVVIPVSVMAGCVIALIGYAMIAGYVASLHGDYRTGKRKGQGAYALRYAFYFCSLTLLTLLGCDLPGMLAGILVHKGALIVLSIREGKN